MRPAVLADVHGNPLALDAVLADAVAVGVDGSLVLSSILSWTHGHVRLLNPGSVSNPWAPDLRASWALLAAHFRGERTPRWLGAGSGWAGDPRTGYTTSFDVLSAVVSPRPAP